MNEKINQDRQDEGERIDNSQELFDAGHTNDKEDIEIDSGDSDELFDAGKVTHDRNDPNEGNIAYQRVECDDAQGMILVTPNDMTNKTNVKEIELQDPHEKTPYI